MRAERNEELTDELLDTVGLEGFIRLADAFGGTRLYVPVEPNGTLLQHEIGVAAASRLCKHYGRSYIRVPLGREHRAVHFRESGMSNSQIARRLGMTETGVDKLFRRAGTRPARPRRQADTFQLEIFPPKEE
ncbi:hypothetical protein [Rhizobium mayense]|uniref:Mor transcription activator domain-containing protein n=1 Tax=Rhizobium mayense TaxID=1312184 RepID=A0ABT7K1G6_9HYPH|nr:hypothetical protein [Rhizobium mayense]MDL2401273.1 hypothetical protein [Rhizobium mayense]